MICSFCWCKFDCKLLVLLRKDFDKECNFRDSLWYREIFTKGYSSSPAPDDEAHLNLVSVVDNELVAAHATRRVVFDLPHRHFDVALEPFASRWLGSSYAYCVSAVASCRKTAGIVVRTIQGSRRSARNLAKHKGADAIADLRASISKRLSNQVGEVDSFAEKVSSNWCLRWRDTHSLREDTHEIGEARSVPKQLLIA